MLEPAVQGDIGRREVIALLGGALLAGPRPVLAQPSAGTPFSNAATHAARQATTTLPIVSFNLGDPVNDGLAASLSRPGGNITGFTIFAPELVPKGLSLLKQAVPMASRIAALWSPGSLSERSASDMLQKAEAATTAVGAEIVLVRFRAVEELEGAFETLTPALLAQADHVLQ